MIVNIRRRPIQHIFIQNDLVIIDTNMAADQNEPVTIIDPDDNIRALSRPI